MSKSGKKDKQRLDEYEIKYRVLFESIHDGIGLIDMQGVLIECNIAINKFLSRHTGDDLIGLNFIQILSIIDKNKDLVPNFQRLMQQIQLDGELKSFEHKIYRSKGDLLWLRIAGSEILIGGQKFIQFIIQDITTRKITEEKLRKSELKLQERVKEFGCIYKVSKLIDNPNLSPESLIYGILELIPSALQFTEIARVCIQYKNNTYTSINFKKSEWKLKANETINGEEIIIEVYYLENLPFLKEEHDLISEIINRLKSCFEEREAQKKLNESEENYRSFSENAYDMVSILQKYEQLKESETKYREAYNRAIFYKDLFGHDMNNILTVINTSADLIPYYLGKSEKPKNIRNIINTLQKQVNRGVKLITNVNALSELEDHVILIESVNVNMYLDNSIEFIKRSFKERDLIIDVDSNGLNFKAQANQLLREVFDNILINAIKYNDNSSVEILVKISEEILDNGSFVNLEFIDNGIGVPDERKEMIFKRGNRELKGSKGMGIGLSLVKKILKNYKGKIWVEDKVKGDYSKGSKFILLIPNSENA